MTEPLVPVDEVPVATRQPPVALVVAAMVVATVFALLKIASEVREGEPLFFDRAVMLAMRLPGRPDLPAGPAWLAEAMRDVTALGGVTVLTAVVVLTATFLLLKRQWRAAALVIAATLSGSWAIAALKELFARPRPTLVDHLMAATSASFPSGHAGNSAIVYLTLASLLFPLVREARLRWFVLGAALLLTGAVGVSRVYLGVHWPSDVLAGWLFGALWALMWWAVEARLLRR